MNKLVMAIAGAVLATSCAGSVRTLPALGPADEVRVMESGAETARITDADAVARVVELVNRHRNGWDAPWFGPPVARTKIEFYSAGEFVGDLGLGDGFFTRTHGDFYSRRATDDELAMVRAVLGLRRP